MVAMKVGHPFASGSALERCLGFILKPSKAHIPHPRFQQPCPCCCFADMHS
jgi:hypothetical protein